MLTLLLFAVGAAAILAGIRPMANLVRNTPRPMQGNTPPGSIVALPVDANLEIFEGDALYHTVANGALAKVTPTASGKFAGFAVEYVDNRTGSPLGGTAGSTTCQVQRRGKAWLTVAHTGTWARTDVDATVYASDSDTFTLSAGTNNIPVGKVSLIPEAVIGAASGQVLVAFEATSERSL
jgi:hypothetical protein